MSDDTVDIPPAEGMSEPVPNVSVKQHSPVNEHIKKGKNRIYCKVPSCCKVLNDLKRYHKRYRICPEHLKMSHVMIEGIDCRFCQLCGKFQPLCDFDGAKRSCRAKLARHNERRQKCKDEEIILDAYTEPSQRRRASDQAARQDPQRPGQGRVPHQQMFKGQWNPTAGYMYHNSPRNDLNHIKSEGMPVPVSSNPGPTSYSRQSMAVPQEMDAVMRSLLSQSMSTRRTNQTSEGTGFERYSRSPTDAPQHFLCGPSGYGHLGQYNGLNTMLGNPPPGTGFQFQGMKQDTAVHLLMGLLEYLTKGHAAQSS